MKSEANLKRRSFLLAASVGGAGVVVAAVTGAPAQPQAADKGVPDAQGKGYQVTDHVLHYYRTARI